MLAGGCTTGEDRTAPADTGHPSGTLRVLAAASLTEAFTELARAFEAAHPDVDVTLSFAASSALTEQIIRGAPADVFASADQTTMDRVVGTGNAAEPRIIARNRLALLVEKGNPKGIRSLADLARPGVVLVLCAPEVPCGRFAAAALARDAPGARPASLEDNVKAVASKVILGEADAGIVYVTDVKAAGDKAEGVEIATEPDQQAVYPMAVTSTSSNRRAAEAWIDFVLSREGQDTLRAHGFLSP